MARRRTRSTPGGSCRAWSAAGVGWNGQVASSVAFAELDYTPGVHAQAADRVHRIGQKLPTTEYWLIAHGTVEEKVCQVLASKQGNFDALIDGKDVTRSFDVHAMLIESLLE